MVNSRSNLRQIMRERRRAISQNVAKSAAEKLATNLLNLPFLLNCQHIGIYFANDGEIDTAPLIEKLCALNKICYLPTLESLISKQLAFVRYHPKDPLKLNRYKIPEPHISDKSIRSPHLLDLVLLPLVAFDTQGWRLGMGGGYYDRTFEFTKEPSVFKPLLVGLAYDFQCVEQIEAASWDVPLYRIVTEKKVYIPITPQNASIMMV